MNKVKLTAKQINEIEEIKADEIGINQSLEIAVNYHANRSSALYKSNKAWWAELFEIHGLDSNIEYEMKKIDSTMYIAPVDGDDDE